MSIRIVPVNKGHTLGAPCVLIDERGPVRRDRALVQLSSSTDFSKLGICIDVERMVPMNFYL